MSLRQFATQFGSACAVLALIAGAPAQVSAQSSQAHSAAQHQESASSQKNQPNALIRVVREATERFQNVWAAENAGYQLQFGCVSGSDSGAMGMHFVNGPLVMDDVLDPTHPEIVIYEPIGNGRLRLIGADFLVLADVWHQHHSGPPEIMGQLLHLFDAPNRFGLPAFYTLHVWAWKENSNGAFVNWHPDVSCERFNGTNP
jgi:hypothetical protein